MQNDKHCNCIVPPSYPISELALFIKISWNNWNETSWTTLFDNDLDLLLPFKQNKIRRRLGTKNIKAMLQTTLTFGFPHAKHSLINLTVLLTA